MRWAKLRPHRRRTETDSDDSGERRLAEARERMVRQQIEARGLTDPELLRAMRVVPRHRFVDVGGAYEDRALPVGAGQTISQPYIVAAMTDAARPPSGYAGASVLEVGTGSGYQAAILAEQGAELTSIERHPDLSADAQRRLTESGYPQVRLVIGDGTRGWPQAAPYDAIIVTAAGPSVPQPLLEQLSPDGGRLVMPVGSRQHQMMTVAERRGDDVVTRELDACVFVPLLGEFGFGGD
jgi:protein-L-isoaspartate(D-aspartate) O-methyltransferase